MEQPELPHKLTLTGRKKLTLEGVREVLALEDTVLVLSTALGVLIIEGQALKLKSMCQDTGQASVEGTVSALTYEQSRSAGGFWRRLFR